MILFDYSIVGAKDSFVQQTAYKSLRKPRTLLADGCWLTVSFIIGRSQLANAQHVLPADDCRLPTAGYRLPVADDFCDVRSLFGILRVGIPSNVSQLLGKHCYNSARDVFTLWL